MANICWFEMRMRGTKQNCYDMLNSDMNCYEASVTAEEGTEDDYMMYVFGECPWSVTSSMIEVKNGQDTLAEKAKKYRLELEVCAMDESQEVREHFHYKGDETIVANNLPFAVEFWAIEDGELDLSEEDLAKYDKREDLECYILKDEYQVNVSYDEDSGELEFDFAMSFDDLGAMSCAADDDDEDIEDTEDGDNCEDGCTEYLDDAENSAITDFNDLLQKCQGKTDDELADISQEVIGDLVTIAYSVAGDNFMNPLVNILSACIRIGCGSIGKNTKREAIVSVTPEPLCSAMDQLSDILFGEATDMSYRLIDTILGDFPEYENSLFTYMLAMAFAGGEVDNNAIEKIRDIHKLNNFYKQFDDMPGGIDEEE